MHWPVAIFCLLATAAVVIAQYEMWNTDADYRTAREAPSHSTGTPEWKNEAGFDKDVFTFARIKYSRNPYAWGSAGRWITDFPDSDLNLSYRLQQMTSLKVDPDGRVIKLTDSELFGVGRLRLPQRRFREGAPISTVLDCPNGKAGRSRRPNACTSPKPVSWS